MKIVNVIELYVETVMSSLKSHNTGVVRRDMTLKNLLEYRLILQLMEVIEGF